LTGTARSRRLFDRPYLLLTLTILFWSGNFIIGRAVHGHVPPVGLAFWRWFGGCVLLLVFARPPLLRDRAALLRSWRVVLLLSAIGIAAFNSLVYVGLQSTEAINGLLMQSTMPVMIVGMSYLIFRETVSPLQGLGVAVSLAGAVWIVARGDPSVLATLTLNGGDVVIVVAVACYATYSTLLRKRPKVDPFSFLAVTFGLGALILLPFYLWESFSGNPMRFDRTTLLACGYVAVFPSILAYLCFNRGVELIGANRAGQFVHLMPVFGSGMAILFLGESFQAFHAVGMVLILSGIFLATRRR
tara:strand:- start:447 stop:1349 length:903 start_codon:yes stop_codon:yes gene_type:complete